MKRIFALLLALALAAGLSSAAFALEEEDLDMEYYTRFKGQNISINVYNWGEYISDGSDDSMNVNKEFEELTGIKVNYTNFATNEELYAKLKTGGVSYDVIIPSDYMVARMINEGMLSPINFDNVPNFKHISEEFKYQPMTRRISIRCLIPGVWWASSTIPPWWMKARIWRPGTSCGMRTTLGKS